MDIQLEQQTYDNSRRKKTHLSLLVSAIDYCAHDEMMMVDKDENSRSFGNQQMAATKSGDGPGAGMSAITITFGSVASSVLQGTV